MPSQMQHPLAADQGDEDRLPSFSEQVAEQLGGWRGLIESSIPVIIFVLVNMAATLRPAILVSVGVALGLAVWRLAQRRPVRHALNGIFGIALGAAIAWNTGEEKDFYLPGILISLGYAVALLGSVALRQPLVGWLWSVVAAGGRSDWRTNPRLLRAFAWLTVGWAAVYLAKVAVQSALYAADMATALGVARILLGFPPYALLLAGTIWAVRRIGDSEPVAGTVTEPAAAQ
jgi:hypothetical protein